MEEGRRERLIREIEGERAEARARALSDLRLLDLGDVRVLTAALRACDDTRPMPAGLGSGASSDPFAAFFGGQKQISQTVGEHAAERLVAAGLPGLASVAQGLADSLQEPDAGERRAAVIARLVAESPWEDRREAVALTLPGLLAADTSLFAVVATADEASLDLLRSAALNPFHPRLVNELLNCEPARPSTLDALAAAAAHGLQPPDVALQVVALLHQWRYEGASEASAALEEAHPWAMIFTAVTDPAARPRLTAWLQAPGPDTLPPELPRLAGLILEHAEPMADYPLAAVLERLDGDCGPVVALEAVEACARLLRRWVRAGLADGRRLDRAWRAVALLAERHLLGEVAGDVVAAIRADEAPLHRALLEDLARHEPALPGLPEGLADLAERHPDALSAVVPALRATSLDLATFADRALGWAEAAPVEQVRRPRGLVETRRAGIDIAALQELVASLGRPELSRRLDEVLPVIGPAR